MSEPRRLCMSRRRGANLHAFSHAANGLPVRVVTRATIFGNPFRFVRDEGCLVFTTSEGAEVVSMFRRWCCDDPAGQALSERIRRELRGHNVACFCRLCMNHRSGLPLGEACRECAPCHGDVILAIAAGRQWMPETGTWDALADA